MAAWDEASRVTAVLGPTNTGKTHLAIERMLGYSSGMIGFPLRLLARENYDRIVKVKGRGAVALVTGEERIIPPHPQWFVATVEAMPLDREVDFLAVDEIQLIGDAERGHVFTERLLHARGRHETMFMGSDTARNLLKKLVPEAEIIARPRFSTLEHTGPRKVTRLPPRSAVVAFSVTDVFEIAELVRRQRGGTAVVMGALSPRARNAQVAMYQAGEVDYMVATDAIGMGLNMDLDHVALARLSKFDGRGPRALKPAEIAQIAGRAGRHMNNGTFGTTAEAGPLDPEIVASVENHSFDPLTAVWWRNDRLDFRSPQGLLNSLDQPPPLKVMQRMSGADDQVALQTLSRQPDIVKLAGGKGRVRLLWDVCQIPDFRKVMSEHHARLLGQIYRHLASPMERLPADWVAHQIGQIERFDGDIDTLVGRIAHIRTWTYITHRPGWLDDPGHWQERTRGIEDRLSDALHDRITQRFVDRRSALLVKYLDQARELMTSVSAEGEVLVEGHFVGEMTGFRFAADRLAEGDTRRMLLAAANRVLRGEVQARAKRLAAEGDTAFALAPDGQVLWHGVAVARLVAGETALTPHVEVQSADFLDGALRDEVRRRLETFVGDAIRKTLGALLEAPHPTLPRKRERAKKGEAPVVAATSPSPVKRGRVGVAGPATDTGPAARGLIFRLAETLGTLDAATGLPLMVSLTPEDRHHLTRRGFRFGTETIYAEALLKPAAVALRGLLWSVFHGATLPATLPPPGRLSVEASLLPSPLYGEAIGYRVIGPRAIRVDRLEQLAASLRQLARIGPFALNGGLASLVGAPATDLPAIVAALGYRAREIDGVVSFTAQPRRLRPAHVASEPAKPATPVSPDHPFAKLRELAHAR